MFWNAIVFSIIALWYYKKSSGTNIGSFMLGVYAGCAWAAYFYHEHEFFEMFRGKENFTIEPFLYLIPTILLFMIPILKFDSGQITRAVLVDEKFMIRFAICTCAVQCILYVILVPAVKSALLAPDIGEYRDELYDEEEVVKYPHYVFNMLDRLYMGARNVVVIISAFALAFMKRHRMFYKFFFVTSFGYPIYHFIAYVSRAVMVMQIAFSVFIILILTVFISKRIRKKIMIGLAAFTVPVAVAFWYISQSRFAEMASYMMYRYLGESFNNYNAEFYHDLRGNTWGQAYFVFLYRLFGSESNFTSTREKWDYLDRITNVDTHVFYTFVGGLNIEFGFVYTIIIGIVLSFLICKLMKPYNELTLPKMILIGMLGYTLINGAFFFVLQGDWGNLEILFAMFLAFVFHLRTKKKFIQYV